MQDSSMHFDPKLKKTLLQNALSLVPDLNQVKINAQQLVVNSGIITTYESYCKLLLSAAEALDETLKKTSVRPQRQTYETNLDEGTGTNGDTMYNIDTTLPELEINHMEIYQTSRGNPAARIPDELWNNLQRRERQGWNEISNDNKVVILKTRTPSASYHSPPSVPRPGERSTNQ
jgi:hypothetical protein